MRHFPVESADKPEEENENHPRSQHSGTTYIVTILEYRLSTCVCVFSLIYIQYTQHIHFHGIYNL